MKIKNKKGFTLPELLAAVVIIGILSTIAVVSVNNVMKKSHKEYDIKQNKLFTTAAQTYFTDNRSELPRKLLTEKEVTLSELIKENYIEEIVDYKKELYNQEESKAYVKKMGRGKYSYYSKLVGSDGRVISDKEVSKRSGNISVSINKYDTSETDMPRTISKDIYYVNKILKIDISGRSTGEGISSYQYKIERLKNERDKIGKKYKSSGEIEVDNKAFTDTITINAKDFANGVYKLVVYAYDYEGATSNSKESKIIVIDKTKPKCTIKMSRAPDGLEVENAKPANKWYKAGDLTALMNITETNKYKYAIGLDEQTTNITYDKNNTKDKEEYPIENNVVGKYVYGYIQDKAGNIGKCQTDKPVYYDQTNPSCTISLDPDRPDGQNGWYTKDVKLSMTSEDTSQNPNESGVGVQELTPDNIRSFPIQVPPLYTNTIEAIQGETKVKTWYGHVRDKAGNEATCDTGERVKVDKTPPKCSVTISGKKGNYYDRKHWYIEYNPSASLSTEENTSGIAINSVSMSNYIETGPESLSLKHDDDGYIYGTVKDNAGHTGYCISDHIAVDTKKPTCSWDGTSTTWTNNDRKIILNCDSDEGSGCGDNFWYKEYTTNTKTDYQSHDIWDYAGNKKNCSKTLNVYVDKTPPTLSITKDPNSQIITASCTDDGGSGLVKLHENVGKYGGESSYDERDSTCIRLGGSDISFNNKCEVTGSTACINYHSCQPSDNPKHTQFKCKDAAGNVVKGYRTVSCTCGDDNLASACHFHKDSQGNSLPIVYVP